LPPHAQTFAQHFKFGNQRQQKTIESLASQMPHDQHDVLSGDSPEAFVTLMLVMFSAATGWIPIVSSNAYLLKPIFMATAKPCIIYPALGPA
jgi:hypothetical protein